MTNCWCGGRTQPAEAFGSPSERLRCLDSPFHDPTATGRPEAVSKLYVAGPMSGYPNNNYPEFNHAAAALRAEGFEVVNPAEYGIEGAASYPDLLRADLLEMLSCHGVATLENWWESVGARNEVQVAGLLRMPIRPFRQWLVLGPTILDTPKEN